MNPNNLRERIEDVNNLGYEFQIIDIDLTHKLPKLDFNNPIILYSKHSSMEYWPEADKKGKQIFTAHFTPFGLSSPEQIKSILSGNELDIDLARDADIDIRGLIETYSTLGGTYKLLRNEFNNYQSLLSGSNVELHMYPKKQLRKLFLRFIPRLKKRFNISRQPNKGFKRDLFIINID